MNNLFRNCLPFVGYVVGGGGNIAAMRTLVDSGAIVKSDGGGWDCISGARSRNNPEDTRTSYAKDKRPAHNALLNAPGNWLEAPVDCKGRSMYFCFKCPSASGAGMLDYVTLPRVRQQQACKVFHTSSPVLMTQHVNKCGVKHKPRAVTQATPQRRVVLTSLMIPFVMTPRACCFYGSTLASEPDSHKKCCRIGCPINTELHKTGSKVTGHPIAVFSENDYHV